MRNELFRSSHILKYRHRFPLDLIQSKYDTALQASVRATAKIISGSSKKEPSRERDIITLSIQI